MACECGHLSQDDKETWRAIALQQAGYHCGLFPAAYQLRRNYRTTLDLIPLGVGVTTQ